VLPTGVVPAVLPTVYTQQVYPGGAERTHRLVMSVGAEVRCHRRVMSPLLLPAPAVYASCPPFGLPGVKPGLFLRLTVVNSG